MQKPDKKIEDVISALRQNGVEYNDIIEKYGIDSSIVEQYEDKHYEHGYGDVSDEYETDIERRNKYEDRR